MNCCLKHCKYREILQLCAILKRLFVVFFKKNRQLAVFGPIFSFFDDKKAILRQK